MTGGRPLACFPIRMEKGRITEHWLTSADAADLFEGPRLEERTLIDACRTPFSFGLILLIPVVLMVVAFVLLLQSRATLMERFTFALPGRTPYLEAPNTEPLAKRSSH